MGTPYVNYTLELDDRIESPSVNFNGMDCWTFYEISLAFWRMLRAKDGDYRPEDLLALIELERYRDGRCTGGFLSRKHFLEEVFANNSARGLSTNPTSEMGGVRLTRNITEMTMMGRVQDRVSALPSITFLAVGFQRPKKTFKPATSSRPVGRSYRQCRLSPARRAVSDFRNGKNPYIDTARECRVNRWAFVRIKARSLHRRIKCPVEPHCGDTISLVPDAAGEKRFFTLRK